VDPSDGPEKNRLQKGNYFPFLSTLQLVFLHSTSDSVLRIRECQPRLVLASLPSALFVALTTLKQAERKKGEKQFEMGKNGKLRKKQNVNRNKCFFVLDHSHVARGKQY